MACMKMLSLAILAGAKGAAPTAKEEKCPS